MNSENQGSLFTVTIGAKMKNRFHVWLVKGNIAKHFKVRRKDVCILGTRPFNPDTKEQEVLVWVDKEIEPTAESEQGNENN